MGEKVSSLLRGIRTSLQVVSDPIDWVSRTVNGKEAHPPLWLRQKVGDLKDFEGSCGEYVAYLKLLCGLKPGDTLLDIGCGCGLILLDTTGSGSLPEYLKPGNYIGVDTDKPLIDWCRRNIRYPNTFFQLVDGKGEHLPIANNFFDIILAKSLFTHLLPHETNSYLELIRDSLKFGGRCLSTWFLLKGRFGQELKGRYTFKWVSWPEAYERITRPKLAVAYDEEWLTEKIKEIGLEVETISYGTWSGRQDGLSFQDIIIVRKWE